MALIRTISLPEAHGPVREMYEQVEHRFGYVPNWARAFSLRPAVRDGWAALLTSVQCNLSARTYQLATLAGARTLRSSYCSPAHGSVHPDQVFDTATVTAIMKDAPPSERAMMAFVEKVGMRTASPPQTSRYSGLTATRTRRSSMCPLPQQAVAFSANSSTP
jgi:alkylhydroperoxidase family enzyme